MEDLRLDFTKLQFSSKEKNLVEQLIRQSELEQVVIGFFGPFSVGKSELLNRIVGQDGLLPTHTNETTAIVTSIIYGNEDKIELIYKDGHVENTSRENLHTLVAGENVTSIEKITVTLTEPEWLKQIEFIDTPGRNTKFTAHVETSKEAIINANVAVYVLPWQGITAEDIVYLKELMIYQSNLYFILNKVDRIEEGQGQTIDDVLLNVKKELADQLGKDFLVYAVSAKTGFNLSIFQNEFIPKVFTNIKKLKHKRFIHTIDGLIARHVHSIENEIKMLELANSHDEQALHDHKRKLELEQTKLNDHVDKELSILKEVLGGIQADARAFIETTLRLAVKQLKNKLLNQYTQQYKTETINTIVNNCLLTARNEIYFWFEAKVNEAMVDKKQFKITELESLNVNIEYQEPSFEELQERYQNRLQKLAAQYDERKNRLQQMLTDTTENGLGTEIEEVQQVMHQIEEQMHEEYVPNYKLDENFDPTKATKISKLIGQAGDVVLGVVGGILTSGVSTSAQIAGKAGAEAAKQTGKQVTKQITKQVVKETGKEVVKQTAKQAGKEALKRIGIKSLKVIGNFTSPVETVATKIGEVIDSNRKENLVLDTEHRQKFFMKKQQIESQFQFKTNELSQLREQQRANATLVRNIEGKIKRVDQNKEEELKKLEQSIKQDQARLNKIRFEESIQEQMDSLCIGEQDKFKSWVKLELDRVMLMLENTLPSYYKDELSKLTQQIETIETESKLNKGTINDRLSALHQELSSCIDLKQGILHD